MICQFTARQALLSYVPAGSVYESLKHTNSECVSRLDAHELGVAVGTTPCTISIKYSGYGVVISAILRRGAKIDTMISTNRLCALAYVFEILRNF